MIACLFSRSDEEVMSTMQALPRAPTHAAPPPSLLPAAPAPRHSCTNDAWMHWSSRLAVRRTTTQLPVTRPPKEV
jgi:hypothetical protein